MSKVFEAPSFFLFSVRLGENLGTPGIKEVWRTALCEPTMWLNCEGSA